VGAGAGAQLAMIALVAVAADTRRNSRRVNFFNDIGYLLVSTIGEWSVPWC
jgi:hypothetical protein